MQITRLAWLLSFLISFSLHAVEKRLSLLEDGSHCVAYRAKKRMFLVNTINVVGKSCDVAIQVMPETGGLYHVEMTVPIRSLKSGEEKRDQDVARLLKADQEPEMVFRSNSLSLEEWQRLIGEGQFRLNGQLKVAGSSHPIESQINVVKSEGNVEVDGLVKTSFKNLQLKPPRLAMGLFASVKDDLELHFHFVGHRTLGADSIFGSEVQKGSFKSSR